MNPRTHAHKHIQMEKKEICTSAMIGGGGFVDESKLYIVLFFHPCLTEVSEL